MQYNSFVYLTVFLPIVVLLYYVIPKKRRWIVLLAASLGFYWLSGGYRIFVIMLSAVSCYGAALWLEKQDKIYAEKKGELDKAQRKQMKAEISARKRRILVICILSQVLILVFCKYLNFLGENLNAMLGLAGIPETIPAFRLLMPLGVSFYTLSAIGYIADVHMGKCSAQRNYGRLLLFLIFFPIITEGPICRYDQLGKELEEEKTFSWQCFSSGLLLILWGLFKKVVLADRVNHMVQVIFSQYTDFSGWAIIMGIMLYTFQIYMDFSGCIDITRGSAALFGIAVPDNFNQPFFSASVNEFWRRWHMTLGAWLRDYIFYPISLSKRFMNLSRKARASLPSYYAAAIPSLIALAAVWLGNGVWHGAEWKYIVYGLYYYVIMALGMLLEPAFQKGLGILHINRESFGYHLFQMARTFVLVNIGMTIFRADSVKEAVRMLSFVFVQRDQALGFRNYVLDNGIGKAEWLLLLVGLFAVFLVGIWKEKGISVTEKIQSMAFPLRLGIYIAGIMIVVIGGAYGAGFGAVDFIYAQF
ncbi:MAG: MBOAT family protein [Clostridiales bacterium]|nr:MBOAT family protein [Clostridiales bacterium]